MSSDTPLDQDQKDALANAVSKHGGAKSTSQLQNIDDVPPQLGYDLSRSYGRNWTKTNVNTLFDWLTVAAFNIQCLEYAIEQHRSNIRNFTIYGLLVSTLSGTISLSQFGIEQGHVANKILQGVFTFFTFSLAIYTGYVKIYQIQERLEQFIKLRQDWAVFATTIGSELQLPIDLRRDALHLIVKYKSTYLDLIKIELEIPEHLRIRAEQSLPKTDSHIQVTNLPSTIINIGMQEMDDLIGERRLDKDRFSVISTSMNKTVLDGGTVKKAPAPAPAPAPPQPPHPPAPTLVKKEQIEKIQIQNYPPSKLEAEIVATPLPQRNTWIEDTIGAAK
jgi:hypothetical protein